MLNRIMRSPEEGAGGDEVTETPEGTPEGTEKQPEQKPKDVIPKAKAEALITERLRRDRDTRAKELGFETWDEASEALKSAREAREAEQRRKEKEATLEERTAAQLQQAAEKHKKELEAARLEIEAAQNLASRVGVKQAIRREAEKAGAFDEEDIVRLAIDSCRLNPKTEEIEIVDAEGFTALDDDGKPLTLEGKVAELRARSPHLFRAGTKPGADETASDPTGTRTISREDFDKKSPTEQLEIARQVREGKARFAS